MGISFFIRRLINIFSQFSEEWISIREEKGYARLIFFAIYISLLTAISFLISTFIYTGSLYGIKYMILRSSLVFLVNLILTFILALLFSKLFRYYADKEVEFQIFKLSIYVISVFFVGNMIGYIVSPDNFFFISFIASFFSTYYFYQGASVLPLPHKEILVIGLTILFFILLLVSFFLINNTLAILK